VIQIIVRTNKLLVVLKARTIGNGKHTIFDRHHRYRTVVLFLSK